MAIIMMMAIELLIHSYLVVLGVVEVDGLLLAELPSEEVLLLSPVLLSLEPSVFFVSPLVGGRVFVLL
ncbi:hypothetical protein KDK_19940 [Dictyobacter kobayashii]|uniref:Uncharacterized protein n=1 Tax=Dictyobacter kobayashii TaxID=2014872 RepID=A0A402AGL9_9CHLR|nr:hypothetical protein KDK_19940 [Dictyobacter kobayashii]